MIEEEINHSKSTPSEDKSVVVDEPEKIDEKFLTNFSKGEENE